mgnify:CR=1 FL=1
MATRDPDGLTLKQRRFVQELPLAKSATEAAIKAGYGSGKHENAAHVRAYETVRKPAVAKAIAEMQEKTMSAAIATLIERKEALSRVLREPESGPYPVQSVIAASDQLNRMERVYGDAKPSETNIDNRTQILMAYSPEQLRALLAAMSKSEDAT